MDANLLHDAWVLFVGIGSWLVNKLTAKLEDLDKNKADGDQINEAVRALGNKLHDIERKVDYAIVTFDNEVLSKYQGKAIHLFGFKQTYNFKHGITYDKILYDIARADPSLPRSGKFSIPGNELVAKEVYNLIKN